jgi:hypothetical protein
VVIYELLDVSEEAERKIACRSEFEEAMQAFRQGDFMQASLYFHTLVQKLPDDPVVQIFREKTEDFLQQGLSHPGYLDFESKD